MDNQSPSVALDRLATRSMIEFDHWADLADERDRIARDLHDIVVQRLFLAGLKIARAAGRQPDDDDLIEVLDDIDHSIADLRAVIFGLQRPRAIIGVDPGHRRAVSLARPGPSENDDGHDDGHRDGHRDGHGDGHDDGHGDGHGDLSIAVSGSIDLASGDPEPDDLDTGDAEPCGVGHLMISRIVADLAGLIGHRPELTITGDIDAIADEILTECGVVVRELLVNALKHAHSTQTWVTVGVDDGWITIVVEDDGDGVRTLHPAQGGTGLRSLSERARRNGGAFAVEARHPSGTRVCWSVRTGG